MEDKRYKQIFTIISLSILVGFLVIYFFSNLWYFETYPNVERYYLRCNKYTGKCYFDSADKAYDTGPLKIGD
jgi:hypothetical protein